MVNILFFGGLLALASQHTALAQRNPKTNLTNCTVLNQVSPQQNVPGCPTPGGEQKARPVAQSIPVKQASDSPRPHQFHPLSSQMSDGKGMHMLQSRPPNIHSVQVQPIRHHVQHPQAPSPVFGTNNFHARPFLRPVGGPVAPLRPQMVDSSQKAQLVQGAVTTVAGGVPTRPTMPVNVPANQSARQHLANKEQRTNSFTSTAHTSMEAVSQHSESTANSFPAMQSKQVNQVLGSSKSGVVLENQSPMLSASKSLAATSSSQSHQSHARQAEPKMQVSINVLLC
jgi:transcription initiation factor TFIID subunit 4